MQPPGKTIPWVGTILWLVFLAGGTLFALDGTAGHVALPARAGVYYVATTGSDTNPGTIALPWQTIGKAADTLAAGDTVYIRTGTYPERVQPQHSGSSGNPIVYAAYPGETVTVDGTGVEIPEWGALFEIVEKNWITVSGLRVIHAGPNPHNPGILVDTCAHIVVEYNFVSHTNDSGIGVWSSQDVTVAHNEVEWACQAGYNECISVGVTDGFAVGHNHVHHSEKEGIAAKDGSSNGLVYGNRVHHTTAVGYYVDAQARHTYNIDVFGNVAHDIAENGFALASEVGGLLEHIRVYNNLGYRNGWTGLHVTTCCNDGHPMSDLWIVNNTFCGNGQPPWGGGILLENPQAVGVVIRNNICSGNLTFQLAVGLGVPTGNYTADHNLIDGFMGDEGEIYGEEPVIGNPAFLLPAAGDFHVTVASPATGAASLAGLPATDFDGVARPDGGAPDLGAYESLVTVPPAGDLNGDGQPTVLDLVALLFLNRGALSPALSPCRFPSAVDMTGDGLLNAADESALAHWLAGSTVHRAWIPAVPRSTGN